MQSSRVHVLGLLVVALVSSSSGLATQKARPVLKVGPDGFPAGHASPEGVACDFTRAFIKLDSALLKDACAPLRSPEEYVKYLEKLQANFKRKAYVAAGPKRIIKVFAVRRLSHDGPASYAYSVLEAKDVEFVDLRLELQTGRQVIRRNLVIQGPNGKWYVHPAPAISPLLSMGLNEESPSTKEIGAVYTLKRR